MYFVKSLLYRHPSWRSEETQERERSRTGSESSQTGTSATSGRSKSDQGGYLIIALFRKLSITKLCRDFGVLAWIDLTFTPALKSLRNVYQKRLLLWVCVHMCVEPLCGSRSVVPRVYNFIVGPLHTHICILLQVPTF